MLASRPGQGLRALRRVVPRLTQKIISRRTPSLSSSTIFSGGRSRRSSTNRRFHSSTLSAVMRRSSGTCPESSRAGRTRSSHSCRPAMWASVSLIDQSPITPRRSSRPASSPATVLSKAARSRWISWKMLAMGASFLGADG
jgi:hypothetical protein